MLMASSWSSVGIRPAARRTMPSNTPRTTPLSSRNVVGTGILLGLLLQFVHRFLDGLFPECVALLFRQSEVLLDGAPIGHPMITVHAGQVLLHPGSEGIEKR